MLETIANIIRFEMDKQNVSAYSVITKHELFSQSVMDAILQNKRHKGKGYNVMHLIKICQLLGISEIPVNGAKLKFKHQRGQNDFSC